MNRQNRIEDNEANDEEENFDYSNFNPDVLTNSNTDKNAIAKNQGKINFEIPPDEDFIFNNTLWPEDSKLYGHGYEIISLAISHNGKFAASGAKSQSEKNSKLFIWDTEKNSLIKKLDGHVLTIVQIEFSYDDKYILTVSRDRSLCIYERNSNLNEEDGKDFKLLQMEKETHMRIIWGCAWSFDSKIFLSGSRDNSVKVWLKKDLNNGNNINNSNDNSNSNKFCEVICKEFDDAVTSVCLFDRIFNDKFYCGIIGLENGELILVKIYVGNDNDTNNNYDENKEKKDCSMDIIMKFPKFLSHGLAVKRIKSFTKDNLIKIASCSDDHTVRLFELSFDYIENLIK
jgi:elongator complex protein 2